MKTIDIDNFARAHKIVEQLKAVRKMCEQIQHDLSATVRILVDGPQPKPDIKHYGVPALSAWMAAGIVHRVDREPRAMLAAEIARPLAIQAINAQIMTLEGEPRGLGVDV